uniref:Uncharacterized protein n=1 Tax=Helianthus annuus TaxID=4232 RepID=A0A251S809_HELAN
MFMEAWNEAGQTEQVRKGKRNLDARWRLGMKRVKRSKYEKESVIWMRVLGTQGLWVTIKQLLKDRTHTLEASA